SIAGGGRYDNLIGIFAGRDIPAVGFSFGFDRLIEAMEELNLFPKNINENGVFVAFSSSDLQEKALEITTQLRKAGINSEYYLEDTSLEKQLKYADKKQIPYSIVISDKELILKDMEKRTQENLSLEEIIKKLK
nr:ATP phosphoribosyltransferase regulatory subunit [Candidatus Levybacteria bacterium]